MTAAEATQSFALSEWLSKAKEMDASDVHLHSGYPPLFRLNGAMKVMDSAPIADAVLRRELTAILSADERRRFDQNKDLDFVYEIPAVARYRGSLFLTYTGINASFRVLSAGASKLEDLGLPVALQKVIDFHQGLVLITGPAGSGKTSTIAAIVNLINEKHHGHHILTLESPIEILHPNKSCIVNQRQVPLHTESFERGIHAALRENLDVLVLGEMIDPQTINAALEAAETGHLVIASMHTPDALTSITRIIDSFPPDKQPEIRIMLAESLQAIFSQLLLPSTDGKRRLLAYELLLMNATIANMIKDDKTFQIPSIMETGRAAGMMTLGQTLGDMAREGTVSREVARMYVDDSYLF